ncbi:MAG: hypothetical protein HYV09_10385 [Deltaproteobacteria bacterium]|nr:hypothetical protein [Deltaproteobacteria bacterium]
MRLASSPSLRSVRGAFALVTVLVAMLAAAMSACIIGPKQDDPAEDTPGGKTGYDAAATSDTSPAPMDGSTGAFDDGGAPEGDAIAGGDAAADSGASDAPADAPSDAPSCETGSETGASEAGPCEHGGSDAISDG